MDVVAVGGGERGWGRAIGDKTDSGADAGGVESGWVVSAISVSVPGEGGSDGGGSVAETGYDGARVDGSSCRDSGRDG